MGRPRSSNPAFFALPLLALPAAALSQESGGERSSDWKPVAVEGRGDPNSLAWDRANGRVALGHGTRVELWKDDESSVADPLPETAFHVDHTLMDLELSGDELWVAASTGGLVRARGVLDPEAIEVAVLHTEARPCVALDLEEGVLWALFAGLDANRVLAFDAGTLAPLAAIGVPRGIGQDLLFDGRALWVSCGAAGLARIDGPLGEAPKVEWLADPRSDFPRAEAPAFPRTFGELARGAHHLFVAGDDLGVVRLALDAQGKARGEPRAQRLRLDALPTYVSSLAAEPERGLLAVGSNRAPRAAALGAPYGVLGWLDHRFDLAGVDPHSFEHGSAEGLTILTEQADGLKLNAQATQGAADWRGMELHGTVLFEQHAGRGRRRARLAPGEVRRLPARSPEGWAPVDVAVSLLEPGLLRLGLDPAGSTAPGPLRFTDEGRLEVDATAGEPADFRLFVGEPWLDDAGDEWFLAGGGLELKLWRRRSNGALQSWPLGLPADERGRRGHTYFGASKFGDLLAITRAQCDAGLLLVDATELLGAARATPPGKPIALLPTAALATRIGREPYGGQGDPLDYVWSPSLRRDGDGRLWGLLPAGLGHAERGEPARALLFDLTSWSSGEVGAPTVVEAPVDGGHAIDAQLVLQDGRLLGFVGDLVHGVHLFDLHEPSEPRWVSTTAAPASPYDGRLPNLFDLEWRAERAELWVAYGRGGFRGYRADRALEGLEELRAVDTPGLALKLAWRQVHGVDTLFVADQKAGVRVYR